MKNNLFYYATSELSQDAFLCYLASFALTGAKDDPILRSCAKSLLTEMVPELSGKDFTLTDVERQVNHIDVLFTVTCGDKKYKIIVEDKVNAGEHDNQLLRYLKEVKEKFQDHIVLGVYYKTGFQSDLSAVIDANYKIISRRRMLELLKPYVEQTANQIVIDYFDYWNDFEQSAQKYQELPLSQWDWRCVNAFYDALQNSDFPGENQVDIGYGYVSNPNGGFDAMWLWPYPNGFIVLGVPIEMYVQVEPSWQDGKDGQKGQYNFSICLKFSLQEDVSGEIARNIRNTIIYDENWNYRLNDYHFHKPGRLGSGKAMTIGIYDGTYETAKQLKNALSAAIDECFKLASSLEERP